MSWDKWDRRRDNVTQSPQEGRGHGAQAQEEELALEKRDFSLPAPGDEEMEVCELWIEKKRGSPVQWLLFSQGEVR